MTDNRIKQIADCNGMKVILNKLTEECGELVTAIARSRSKVFDEVDTALNYAEMIEEAADTLIMIEQLRLQCPDLFDSYKEAKVNRQMQRMAQK